MALIRGLFWLALFLFFTFSFVVLFEYGTHDFLDWISKGIPTGKGVRAAIGQIAQEQKVKSVLTLIEAQPLTICL